MPDAEAFAAIARRLADLERNLATLTGPARADVRVDDTSHHPRPGTWVGDSNEADCRYCGDPIAQDAPDSRTPGTWRARGGTYCAARAAGAPARD